MGRYCCGCDAKMSGRSYGQVTCCREMRYGAWCRSCWETDVSPPPRYVRTKKTFYNKDGTEATEDLFEEVWDKPLCIHCGKWPLTPRSPSSESEEDDEDKK